MKNIIVCVLLLLLCAPQLIQAESVDFDIAWDDLIFLPFTEIEAVALVPVILVNDVSERPTPSQIAACLWDMHQMGSETTEPPEHLTEHELAEWNRQHRSLTERDWRFWAEIATFVKVSEMLGTVLDPRAERLMSHMKSAFEPVVREVSKNPFLNDRN